MMRFLRTLFGCSRFEAALAEDAERERAKRAEVQRQIEAQVRRIEAGARLVARLREDVR